MNHKAIFLVFIVAVWSLTACGGITNSKGSCGDGICDEAEQKNPSLCPADCVQLAPEDQAGIAGEENEISDEEKDGEKNNEWEAEVVWDCDLDYGGNTDKWSLKLNYDFVVDADGRITGSGTGQSTRAECTRKGCDCALSISDISVKVGGLKQGDYFSLELSPEYTMTQCLTCPEVATSCGDIEQLYVCVCTGGPLDVTIEAQDKAIQSFECHSTGLEGIAHGNTVISQK